MTKAELREKIRSLVLQVRGEQSKADEAAIAYDELTKFPELKDIIVSLMTHEFDSFLEGIDWVAPWIAQIEGKKYYLLNLDEEEYAALAISRILQYGPESGADASADADADADADSGGGAEEEVDVDVDVEA